MLIYSTYTMIQVAVSQEPVPIYYGCLMLLIICYFFLLDFFLGGGGGGVAVPEINICNDAVQAST